MNNKFLDLIHKYWNERICKNSTIVALLIVYLEMFHHDAVNQLLLNIFNNEKFSDAIVIAIITFLGWTKLF